jgi:hypothetical protein
MRYFANPTTGTGPAMASGLLSLINTPQQGGATPSNLPAGVEWCADNGCFGKSYVGDERWLAWLKSYTQEQVKACRFATAPDVVGDAVATLELAARWLPVIAGLGYVPALVAQDGLELLDIPWDTFGALFIGGSTAWKLGPAVPPLVSEAKARGKWVHLGRVNSQRRLEYAAAIGCDSADGTYLTFGPTKNLPHVLAWLRKVNSQTVFF